MPDSARFHRSARPRATRGLLGALAAVIVTLLSAAVAVAAEPTTYSVHYGAAEADSAIVHPVSGGLPLLLLHEAGVTTKQTENMAFSIQREGVFTVLNLEWQEYSGKGIWGYDTGQIEEAVRYVQVHAAELGVDPTRLTMLGGSRGANLALLTSENMNAAAPGTIQAVASLSGDVNPMHQIERALRGELAPGIPGKLSKAYGCEPTLVRCPTAYIELWSPIVKASPSAPAMFLAASESEIKTASLPDQYEMAAALQGYGVAAEVVSPPSGHGFEYWKNVRARALALLAREAS